MKGLMMLGVIVFLIVLSSCGGNSAFVDYSKSDSTTKNDTKKVEKIKKIENEKVIESEIVISDEKLDRDSRADAVIISKRVILHFDKIVSHDTASIEFIGFVDIDKPYVEILIVDGHLIIHLKFEGLATIVRDYDLDYFTGFVFVIYDDHAVENGFQ